MPVDNEQKILTEARKQFVQKGFAGVRLIDIATEVGTTKAMVHYYFRTKKNLYDQITGNVLDQLMPKLAGAMSTDGPVLVKIEGMVNTYISLLTEQPDIPFFIMSELSQKRENFILELKKRAHYFPVIQVFFQEIQAEMKAGTIRKMDPVHLLLNVVSMSVFPFMAKPVFSNLLDIPDAGFAMLMQQRKTVILDFVKQALRVD